MQFADREGRFGRGFRGFGGALGEFGELGFRVRVDVVVGVPRGGGGGQDGVPDDGFGGGFGGAGRGVDGFDVEEDLLGVPVEEGADIWLCVSICGIGQADGGRRCTSVHVELDVRVFLLLVAVIVRPALYDLHIA